MLDFNVNELGEKIESFVSYVNPNKITYWLLNKEFNSSFKSFDTLEVIEKNNLGQFNVYFQVHNYSYNNRKEKHLLNINGFFIDIDIKEGKVNNPRELQEKLNSVAVLGFKPHFIIRTAGGWHIHFLTEPIDYQENKDLINNIQSYLTYKLGGDEAFKYKTGLMKVPFLVDIHKDNSKILLSDYNKDRAKAKYSIDEILYLTELDDYKEFIKNSLTVEKNIEEIDKKANFQKEIYLGEGKTLITNKEKEIVKEKSKLDLINELDIEEVIPQLFNYLTFVQKINHDYSFNDGFIYKNGIILSQLRINYSKNTLFDFSKNIESFTGKVSFFIKNFISHVLNYENPKSDKTTIKKKKKEININSYKRTSYIYSSFLNDIYGLTFLNGEGYIVVSKEAFNMYENNILKDGLTISHGIKNGLFPELNKKLSLMNPLDDIDKTELFTQLNLSTKIKEELALMDSFNDSRKKADFDKIDNILNAVILNIGGPSASRTIGRTIMFLSDYFFKRGIDSVEKIKISELFGDYFSENSFRNKEFTNLLMSDLKILSRFANNQKNKEGEQYSVNIISNLRINIEEKVVSFGFLTSYDKSLYQNTLTYYFKKSLLTLDVNNSYFSVFSLDLYKKLFIDKNNKLTKAEALKNLLIKNTSKNWKRIVEKNINLFFAQLGEKPNFSYSKKDEIFIFNNY